MTPAVKAAFDQLYEAIKTEIIEKMQASFHTEEPPRVSARPMRRQGEVDQIADRMLAHITAHPGQSMGEIRRALGIDAAGAQFPMRKLREGKKVAIRGTRAAARYYPKTR